MPKLLRMNLALLLLPVLALCAAAQAPPQPKAPPQSVICYHDGDNLSWADPAFDDSAWQPAQNGNFPAPGYQSDGFFWVRARVDVPAGIAGPLAIEPQLLDAAPNVQELWVNGHLISRYGDFPPHAHPLVPPQKMVFDIPPGAVQPGSVAIIALRIWNQPSDTSMRLVLRHPDPVSAQFSIGSAPLLHALAAEAQDRAWLRFWPQFSLALAFVMLGFAALALSIWARDRQLLLCALWLVVVPVFLVSGPLRSLLAGASAPTFYAAFLIVNALGMCVVLEFLWTVQGFRDRIFRAAAHLCWIALTVAGIFSANWMHPGALALAVLFAANWLLFAFNVITSGANLFALAGRGRNRPVAAAMLFISVGYFFGVAGIPIDFSWLGLGLFGVAFYVSTLFIAILLMRQTWTAWRKGEDLRIEFAAARELQQNLVPAALPHIDRFRLAAAYLPAAEVGGDFYQVIPQPGGSALLVIGDVSGKGLRAAMTGTLVLGALRSLAQESSSPSQMLHRLNQQLTASSNGGFVTCLILAITPGGAITLANAGHIPPYCNGEELKIDSCLPLGVAAEAEYTETAFALQPGQTLTLISDGIVEAQSPTGELYGFDRTAAISTRTAEEIAHAASTFGQQDDITVLTLAFAGAEVVHA
jgi:hypothetical protein